ncbi:hypothetical protein HDU76_007645 [Blyttiomyces sp. JEL0837]|nr:hypothetical protein HDU76_007645 [Blyttiomyces sp. JEL0837]
MKIRTIISRTLRNPPNLSSSPPCGESTRATLSIRYASLASGLAPRGTEILKLNPTSGRVSNVPVAETGNDCTAGEVTKSEAAHNFEGARAPWLCWNVDCKKPAADEVPDVGRSDLGEYGWRFWGSGILNPMSESLTGRCKSNPGWFNTINDRLEGFDGTGKLDRVICIKPRRIFAFDDGDDEFLDDGDDDDDDDGPRLC